MPSPQNSQHPQLPQRLLLAREAVMSYFRPVLKHFGLTEQQWRILRLLAENGEMEAGVIALRACIHAPSLTGILVRMEKAQLVHRARDCNDNRRLIVTPTSMGRTLTERILPLTHACYQQIENHFSADKLHLLLSLLEQLERLPLPAPRPAPQNLRRGESR
ncbi:MULTISPECIES: homoprotocatechuate degradation operon regulator HpaR [Chromobacterium]|uniref:Homoprotocatechuate degradation operon regulator HpaR n=1 Tax=Chromobacterium aquaticum TaxID=467180 RepID=A0ABV8ZTX4_9NEIS|nr:homoprotocatechuate degradation operon regulator HpaR [Chromobacterium aquaticum]MCD5363193.1 homoprotocatechuate degradation operon regulator HpaR [Chromobacterium aquaticum]